MKSVKPRKRLSRQLFFRLFVPLVLVLVITYALCLHTVSNNTRQLVCQQLVTEAAFSCDTLNTLLSGYFITLSSRSSEYSVKSFLKELKSYDTIQSNPYHTQVSGILNYLYQSDASNITATWIVDMDSQTCMMLSEEAPFYIRPSQWDIKDRPWYQSLLTAKSVFVTDYYNDQSSGLPVVSIVVPVRDTTTHSLLGAMGIDLNLEVLSSMTNKYASNTEVSSIIVDSTNTIVSIKNETYMLKPFTDYASTIRQINLGTDNGRYTLFEFNAFGVPSIGSSNSLDSTNWRTITMLPESVITKQVEVLALRIVGIYVISFILLVAIIYFSLQRITIPIRQIAAAVMEISHGNYSLRLNSTSQNELGQLANAVDESIQTLRHKAMFDPLTNIYNEYAIFSQTEKLVKENPDKTYAIIRLDIAQFKIINDMFGEKKGDAFLKFIASVLQDQTPDGSLYGRTNGDIFCLCYEYLGADDMSDFINRITYHITAFPLNFNLAPYFGICLTDASDFVSVSILFDWANLALKSIKGSILSNYAYYNESMRNEIIVRNRIEHEMHHALKSGQFVVFLQPKCDISSSTVVGAEALVRWYHPEDGVVSPGLFVPIFEKNGFIIQLDEFVWEETCKTIKRWKDSGLPPISVSVNVSRIHIFDPDFCNKITKLVKEYDIPFHLLELEFTESAFVDNLDDLYTVMNTLRERGFRLSMDDFGSGYSSLNMLKTIPMDVIKLDREFLNESTSTENGKIIICNTISMLRQLNKQIIAEGVETGEQAAFLLKSGCSVAQGFYYSKPVEIQQFEQYAFHTVLK